MTVRELIEELEKYDEDYEVYGDSYLEDEECVLEVLSVEEGIDRVYIMLNDIL